MNVHFLMNIHSLARLILSATAKLRTPTHYGWRSLALASVLICTARPTTAAAAANTTDFPVWIELDKPGYVTAVIERADGRRVFNLASEVKAQASPLTFNWFQGTHNRVPGDTQDCHLES